MNRPIGKRKIERAGRMQAAPGALALVVVVVRRRNRRTLVEVGNQRSRLIDRYVGKIVRSIGKGPERAPVKGAFGGCIFTEHQSAGSPISNFSDSRRLNCGAAEVCTRWKHTSHAAVP